MTAAPAFPTRRFRAYRSGEPIPLPRSSKGFLALPRGTAWENMQPNTVMYNWQTIFRRLGLGAGAVFLKILSETVHDGVPRWGEVPMPSFQELLGEQERSIRNYLSLLVKHKLLERDRENPWRMRAHPERLEAVPVREPRSHRARCRTAKSRTPGSALRLEVRNSNSEHGGAAEQLPEDPPTDDFAGHSAAQSQETTERHRISAQSPLDGNEMPRLRNLNADSPEKQIPNAASQCPFGWRCPYIVSSLGGDKKLQKLAELFTTELSSSASLNLKELALTSSYDHTSSTWTNGHQSGEHEYASPEDELIALITLATRNPPDNRLIWDISAAVESRGGTPRQFIDDIRPRLERLSAKPGPGFFLDQARKWGGPASAVAILRSERQGQPDVACAHCNRLGRIPSGYCSCAMGRDLERVERRNPARPPDEDNVS